MTFGYFVTNNLALDVNFGEYRAIVDKDVMGLSVRYMPLKDDIYLKLGYERCDWKGEWEKIESFTMGEIFYSSKGFSFETGYDVNIKSEIWKLPIGIGTNFTYWKNMKREEVQQMGMIAIDNEFYTNIEQTIVVRKERLNINRPFSFFGSCGLSLYTKARNED